MELMIENSSDGTTHARPFRVPGEDFDREGQKSTLMELCMLEGLFPLAKVTDRLPFQESELLKFAKQGPFVSCFEQVQTASGGKTSRLLVNITRFVEQFEELASRPQATGRRISLPPARP